MRVIDRFIDLGMIRGIQLRKNVGIHDSFCGTLVLVSLGVCLDSDNSCSLETSPRVVIRRVGNQPAPPSR